MAILEDLDSLGSEESGPAAARSLLFEGQRLDQPAFQTLYEQMPEDFKAELIDGVVSIAMNVHSGHSRSDASMTGLLYYYSVETPGTIVQSDGTTKLGPRSQVQPDSALLIDQDFRGRTRTDPGSYTIEAPELVVEISDTSLKLDLNAKKRVYEEAGALEYLVFDVQHLIFFWFILRDGRFETLAPDPDGIYRSTAFPGLWLDPDAFARNDGRAVMATLRRGLESPEHVGFVERLRENRANRP